MAYADQQGMSSHRLAAIVIVVLLHVVLGYALVTGLAFEAINKVKERLKVVEVEEEKPPEEEPPPPEPDKQIEPPVVSPPPIVRTVSPPQTVQKVREPPPSIPDTPKAAPPAPAAPPPPVVVPPPPAGPTQAAQPKGNPSSWATTNDYPSRALSQEREGTTGFRVSIGADGRVTSCTVTSSSGHQDLDDATCKNVTRRARFKPALKNGAETEGSYSNRIRWEIPK
jgi:periplasmic protein TonB